MTWFTEQRLVWIKENLEIFGTLNRPHVQRKFGISLQSASHDFKMVQERWPDLMIYDTTHKLYRLKKPK